MRASQSLLLVEAVLSGRLLIMMRCILFLLQGAKNGIVAEARLRVNMKLNKDFGCHFPYLESFQYHS